MRKGFLILITVGVCVLLQASVKAQSLNSLPETAIESAKEPAAVAAASNQPLTASDLQTKLNEAKEMLKSQANFAGGNTIVLAVFNRKTSAIDLVSVPKDQFLTKGLTISTTSHTGHAINVTIVRANGVNTAVRVTDPSTGVELK